MTEKEWFQCSDPQAMLKMLWGKASDRKLRLFGCACCHRIWHLVTDERIRTAVEVAEKYADSIVGEARRQIAVRTATDAAWDLEEGDEIVFAAHAALLTVDPGLGVDAAAVAHYASQAAPDEEHPAAQAAFVRCIFGPLPFRSIGLNTAWRTATSENLAEAIYADRAFEHLPILADALEDAGCSNADILNHCRQPGEHVRGCWVVDLLLGKE